MQTITAIYEDGVLKPTEPLDLPEHAEVRVTIECVYSSAVTTRNLLAFLRSLPSLGDDAEAFADDIRDIRSQMSSRLE